MKKKSAIAVAAGLLSMMLVSCNSMLTAEQEPLAAAPEGCGTISLEMKRSDPSAVKSGGSYTTAKDYETVFNITQVLVYDKNSGKLEKSVYMSDGADSAKLTVPAGEKNVWAVVNYSNLEYAGTESELKEWAIDLSENSVYLNEGFLLAGCTTVNVTAGQTISCTVNVSRIVSRVALASVTNSIPSSYNVVLKWACLTNVVGNSSFGLVDTARTWYNPMGRHKENPLVKSHIIDGSVYRAAPEKLTFSNITMTGKFSKGTSHTPEEPYLFYSFPNNNQTVPDGFTSNYSGSKTMLVVAATLNDELMYYPVVLDSLKRNTAYTVYLNLTGPGSDDPNEPVGKSSVGVTIQTEPWIDGGVIDSEI